MESGKKDDRSIMLKALGIRNDCPVAKKCGGCSYAGKTYFEQAAAKEKRVRRLISPFCEVLPIYYCEEPLYYRNKVHSAFKRLKNGRVICGPYESGSHRIVEVESCLIENSTASSIIRDCAEIAGKYKVSIYDEVKCVGDLRRVLVRTADATGEVMVVLIIGSNYFKKKKLFTDELLRRHPEITTLLININKRRDSMILGSGGEVKKVKGNGYITDIILGKRFRVSADSFMQSNHDQAEILYSEAIRLAGFEGNEKCIDAYCGTGSTTLSFADFVENITGIEINESAYNDARKNVSANKVKNAEFVLGDATEYMEMLTMANTRTDCVILDPTRAGTTPAFIEACGKLRPPKIVYISCCPETLARDLKGFKAQGYQAQIAEPVDMFPWTDKIETVVILSKLSNAPKIEVKIKMSELDLTEAEAKATYDEIQEYVKQQTGLHVTHLNIAQIKRKHGIIERVNYNLPKCENPRRPNCPPEKEKAIVAALKHFKMIE